MKTDQWSRLLRRNVRIHGGWLLVAAWLMAPAAFGKHNWFTARTINGQTRPVSAGVVTGPAEYGPFQDKSTAQVTNGLIDLVISLYNNPSGDDDGNTQGNAGSEAQDNYEHIIQYFADGVYEATEGRHTIRNVRIYRGGQRQDADVIWTASGGPAAWPMNTNGLRAFISFYDVFPGSATFTNSADHDVGGYTLAHEWGHYFYGLFDEYCRWGGGAWQNLPAIDKVQPSIMNWQWGARNRVYRWLNYSIAWQGHGTNGVDDYVPFENRRRGAQHQAYGCSGWETLGRNPTNDPLNTADQVWYRNTFGRRMYYPEMATVAPTGTNPPRIDLSSTDPLNTLPSRSSLNIIWMGSNMVVELVIDRSGSMGVESRMDNAKTAAKLLVDQVADGSAVGVVDFDDAITELYPITMVTNTAGRTTIKAAIDTLFARGMTAIGDAADTALNRMIAFGHTNMTRVVFLLSDGWSNTGMDPLDVIPAYQNAQVPIMAFGYGSDVDTCLSQMAADTGGRYYSSPVSLGAIAAAFRDAYAAAAARQILAAGTATASASALKASTNINIPFNVDSTLSDLNATVSYVTSNTVSVTLRSPNGTVYNASSTNESGSERILSFAVTAPTAGVWSIVGSASAGAGVRYQVEAGVREFTYNLTASAAGQSAVSFPAPLEVVATLDKTRAIDGAVVTAQITAPDGSTSSLVLTNNTYGQYSAFYLAASNGTYTVVVQADNSAGTAYLTSAGQVPSATLEGNIPDLSANEPITEDFSRTVSFQVTVSDVPWDLTAPHAPANVSASDGDYSHEVGLVWNAVTNVQVYEIWRHTSNQSGSAGKLTEVAYTSTNYYDTSAANGVVYYYWVKAKNGIGASGFSSSDVGWQQAFQPIADYDGDGKADPGIYNESSGEWRLKLSTYGYALYTSTLSNLVGLDERPLAADFDGDRRADPATYQETSGDWKVMLSGSGYSLLTVSAFLGGPGYTPTAADFDGDSLADPAVYQQSTGNWQAKLSASGYAPVSLEAFGGSGYLAVPADYDGDGLADPAVYQLSTGTWIVMLSASGYYRLEVDSFLGGSGWIPVVGDYDGDGKTDPTVYNESTGEWQVRFSGSNYSLFSVILTF